MAIYGLSRFRRVDIERGSSFNATTSDINFGVAASQDLSVQSTLALIYPIGSGEGSNGFIWGKVPSAGVGPRFTILHNTGNPQLGFGSTSSTSGAPERRSPSASIDYNKWQWVGAAWDYALAASSIRLFIGTTTIPIVEVSSYATSTNGTGTAGIGAGDNLHIGNRENTDRTFNGTIAYVARWNRELNTREFQKAQQYGPLSVPDGLVLCWANNRDHSPTRLTYSSQTAVTLDGQAPPRPCLLDLPSEMWWASIGAAPAGGQPLVKRYSGIPHMRRGSVTFGHGWSA